MTIIMSRASYRGRYLDTPVSEADMRIILEAGLSAPSGCNRQTTSLIAVTDGALLKQLRELTTPPTAETAPAAICVLTQKIPGIDGRFYNVQDYAAAINAMLIAMTALGYSSCWYEGRVTGADKSGQKMAELLGVPEEYELVCYLPVGIAAEEVKRPVKKSFEERAWFNGFNKT